MDSRSVIVGLLDQLPVLYEHTMIPNAAFSSAVQVALLAMVRYTLNGMRDVN